MEVIVKRCSKQEITVWLKSQCTSCQNEVFVNAADVRGIVLFQQLRIICECCNGTCDCEGDCD